MTTQELIEQIKIKKSFLAVGLDVDLNKIPKHLLDLEDPIFEFNKAIIDATHDLCVAYKPNIVAPYMGKDSVEPFLAFENKHTIMLALTSNEGAFDFQTLLVNGQELYKQVLETSKSWKNSENLMYVVGATKAEYFTEVRKIVPDSFLLVPGVGAQGGSLSEVCKYGMNDNIGLLINSSRAIIYASNGTDFAVKAREEALKMQQEMEAIVSLKFQV